MLNDEIEKKNIIKKRTKQQPTLTYQIHDLRHETKITSYKVNQNKL